MNKQDKKDLAKTWLIGSIAVFFTLSIMGILDSQDREITQKKQVKLTVYASSEDI